MVKGKTEVPRTTGRFNIQGVDAMKRINKSLAVALISGGSLGAFGGAVLFHNTPLARAEQQQVAHLEDMATVFRDVGKAVEPSVVQIQVHKTVKGVKGMPFPDDMLR